ncbi:MAG: VOC family protein [Oscillospiraceae bacterium]|nr:VOC family protein [Oscillospiraceae bacterium]MCL2277816.1 VOC family protein [Oscillospiraceae bacterium]
MAKITGLAHVGVFVKDIKRSQKFYTEVLGFKTRWECEFTEGDNTYTICIVENGNLVIELVKMKYPDERTGNGVVGHIAMLVDDLEGMIEQLNTHNIKFDTDAPVHKSNMLENGSKWIFFRGPDDEHLELTQIL